MIHVAFDLIKEPERDVGTDIYSEFRIDVSSPSQPPKSN